MDILKSDPALETPAAGEARAAERPSRPYQKPEPKLYGQIRPSLIGSPPPPPGKGF